MPNTKEIIIICKKYISNNDLYGLKIYYENLSNLDIFISNVIAYEYIYQKIFLHTCIKGHREILEWLIERYKEMDNIRKIALRQMFFYGKYLLKKYKHKTEWYDEFLQTIRLTY